MNADLETLSRDLLSTTEAQPPHKDWIRQRAHRRRKNRFAAVGAGLAVVLAVVGFGLAAGWEPSGQRIDAASEGESLPAPDADASPTPVGPRGEFIWPFPTRMFDDPDVLVDAFALEALGWTDLTYPAPRDDYPLPPDPDYALRAFSGGPAGEVVDVVAQRTDDGGWGLIAVWGRSAGDGLDYTEQGPFSLLFDGPIGAIEATVTANLADGTVVSEAAEPMDRGVTDPDLPGFQFGPSSADSDDAISALVVFRNEAGQAMSVTGGQFVTEHEEAMTEEDAVALPDPGPAGPSQTLEEATDQGIVPELAAMPYGRRVNWLERPSGTTELVQTTGRWIISQPEPVDGQDPVIGDQNGVYGRDHIAATEYRELLLINAEGGVIMYAIPFPSMPMQTLHGTDDAVWALRTGDGALPDTVVARVDLDTFEVTVRVFPQPGSDPSWYDDMALPYELTVGEPLDWGAGGPVGFNSIDGEVTIGNNLVRYAVDPDTLDLRPVG